MLVKRRYCMVVDLGLYLGQWKWLNALSRLNKQREILSLRNLVVLWHDELQFSANPYFLYLD